MAQKIEVRKRCSILNYIKHADPVLYELIGELCIMSIFTSKNKGQGITFLRPNSSFRDELVAEAMGDNPYSVVEKLRRCVLNRCVSDLSEFVQEADTIGTMDRGKKLAINSAESSRDKVVLSNGAEISEDSAFERRHDGDHDRMIQVFIIDKEPSVSGEASKEFKGTVGKKKGKKGGADLSDVESAAVDQKRYALIKKVISDSCDNGIDQSPAVGALASLLLYLHAKKECPADRLNAIKSQLSYDALTSLVILVRPMSAGQKDRYITDSEFKEWIDYLNTGKESNLSSVYYFLSSPTASELYLRYRSEYKGADIPFDSLRPEEFNAPSAITQLKRLATGIVPLLPGPRKSDIMLALAEAEMRVRAAIIADNLTGGSCRNDLENLYLSSINNLDKPVYCSTDALKNTTQSFILCFVSTLYNSNAIYTPDQFGIDFNMKNIANGSVMCLDKIYLDQFTNRLGNSAANFAKLLAEAGLEAPVINSKAAQYPDQQSQQSQQPQQQ